MPLSAAALLQPDCPVKPAWAVFDPVWYFRRYGGQLPAGMAVTPSVLLGYYLAEGCAAAHAPSPLFDEVYYLRANPQIAALVEAGRYTCGFDHYCQLGHRFHSGHWLFDDALYESLYFDLTLENLDANGICGRYDHYLRAGQHEQRIAHLLFDGPFYTAQAIAAGEAARNVEQLGPFKHFLYCLSTDAAELPPSLYFDPAWYRERQGLAEPAIAHYLRGPVAAELDPVPEFSESFYRQRNPDVQAALDAGQYPSGYLHFLQTGVFEFRQPRAEIDLAFYRDANPAVRGDLNTGIARDAFAHLRGIGLKAGLPYARPPESGLGEAAAKQLFLRKARDNLAIFARRRLDFSTNGDAALGVIMVLFDKFHLTMLSLCALRSNFEGAIELILVDNGSGDETANIERYVVGAKIIRLNRNIGYLKACNLAIPELAASLVLFLNNDIELGFGAVESGIARILSDTGIGAVGGKVIRSHGLLQEAGCIIWQDGATSGYMRDASPLAPEANFVRDVDFCSGVFLLCRGEIVKTLGGFDPDFSPAYYEDADLCVRMAAIGYRVVYDPAIVIHHLEYGSGDEASAARLMQRGQKIFQRKHAAFLQRRKANHPRNLTAARSPPNARKNILFIEDTVPLRRLGSGYVRANDIVHALAAGHAVSVFPVNPVDWNVASMNGDFPETVEILFDRNINQLAAFLESRPLHFDLIWISRTHNFERILPHCLEAGIDPAKLPLVLDTEAIATLREAARAPLGIAPDFDVAQALRAEFENAGLCRHCVAVNETEAGLLRGMVPGAVSVLGTMRSPDPTANGFSEREGILFVASIHRADSPNLDALFWYLQEILPALRSEMPVPPILNVAGYVAPAIDLGAFAGHPDIRIHGPAASLRGHYERNRLFIAPTRFAAGTPYKLYEAAAFGLPCVATELLARQLDWQDGIELLAAPVNDPKRFAAQIAQLYRSPDRWTTLRGNALARIMRENTPQAFNATVNAIVDAACRAGNARRLPDEAAGDARPTRGF